MGFAVTFAQWSDDPGNPQMLGSGIQPQVQATSDGGVYIAWLTNSMHVPVLNKLFILSIHLAWKAISPTLRVSSTIKISGFDNVATAIDTAIAGIQDTNIAYAGDTAFDTSSTLPFSLVTATTTDGTVTLTAVTEQGLAGNLITITENTNISL